MPVHQLFAGPTARACVRMRVCARLRVKCRRWSLPLLSASVCISYEPDCSELGRAICAGSSPGSARASFPGKVRSPDGPSLLPGSRALACGCAASLPPL